MRKMKGNLKPGLLNDASQGGEVHRTVCDLAEEAAVLVGANGDKVESALGIVESLEADGSAMECWAGRILGIHGDEFSTQEEGRSMLRPYDGKSGGARRIRSWRGSRQYALSAASSRMTAIASRTSRGECNGQGRPRPYNGGDGRIGRRDPRQQASRRVGTGRDAPIQIIGVNARRERRSRQTWDGHKKLLGGFPVKEHRDADNAEAAQKGRPPISELPT